GTGRRGRAGAGMKSRHGLEIRAATGADAPGLGLLLAAAGVALPAAALLPRLEALRQGAGTALVAVEWGPPSGLVTLHWHRTLLEDRPVARIDLLLVGPEDRRRGLGRLLVEAAAQAARNAGCAMLELAAPSGEASLPGFAHALGFAPAGPGFVRALRKRR
ncbi:GNAT family N-acetyltransferase, partial [Paracraurococcus ruber]